MRPKRLKKIDPRSRGKGQPAELYHCSPWLLKVGTNIRPRWSSFTFTHKVWMTSSHRGAIDVAGELISSLREKWWGYCGTGRDSRSLPSQEIYGVWIYRVKPTGLIENTGCQGEWVSSFPVRILEIIDTVGNPEKNNPDFAKNIESRRVRCSAMVRVSSFWADGFCKVRDNLTLSSAARSDEEIARASFECIVVYNPEAIIKAYERGTTYKEKMGFLEEGAFL